MDGQPVVGRHVTRTEVPLHRLTFLISSVQLSRVHGVTGLSGRAELLGFDPS